MYPEACVSLLCPFPSHLTPFSSLPLPPDCNLIPWCKPPCLFPACVCIQMPHLMQVKSHGLSGSQSLYDPHGVSSSSASPSPSRPPMPRQNSDPTSDTPPPLPLSRLAPPLDKLDRSSWLRQDDDMPPKVSACHRPRFCLVNSAFVV